MEARGLILRKWATRAGVAALALLALGFIAFGVSVTRWLSRPAEIVDPSWEEVDASLDDWEFKVPHVGKPLFLEQHEGLLGNWRLLRVEVAGGNEADRLSAPFQGTIWSRVDGEKWPWHVIIRRTLRGSRTVVEIDASQPYN